MNLGIRDGIAYYSGIGISTEKHCHHALELIFSPFNSFDLISEGHSFNGIHACIILPDVIHQFIGAECESLFIFLEPELLLAEKIVSKIMFEESGIKILPAIHGIPDYETILNGSFLYDLFNIDPSIEIVIGQKERIRDSIAFIKAKLDKEILSSDELAEKAFLSTSRFAHLFKQEIGIPVRKYILWNRLQAAILSAIRGQKLTEAAHNAGFSDSAHLSRTFKEMFGVTPSAILK